MTSLGSSHRSPLPLLVRAALLGLATGGRSSAGLAGIAWTSTPDDPAPLDVLATRRGREAVTTFAFGEAIFDKLPQTPSRLTLGPLVGRVILGAAGGVGLAGRSGAVPLRSLPVSVLVPGALVGAGAAFAGAHLGASWRRRVPFGSDVPAALAEDLVVAAAVWISCRQSSDG